MTQVDRREQVLESDEEGSARLGSRLHEEERERECQAGPMGFGFIIGCVVRRGPYLMVRNNECILDLSLMVLRDPQLYGSRASWIPGAGALGEAST